MVHLQHRDLKKLQECIREIYSPSDRKSFPGHIIRAASGIIPAGVISYADIGHQGKRIIYNGTASCRRWDDVAAFVRYMDQHPVLNYLHPGQLKPHRFGEDIERTMRRRFPSLRKAQHYTAARISDALTTRQFRSLAIFNDFFGRNDVQFQMLVSFLPGRSSYSMISFNRDKKDFSEKERLLLNLLAPHIAQANATAGHFEKARSAYAALEGPGGSLRPYGLTYREEDVLYWVAQGKTNAETAKILNIAPGTVKIHLERIYQKLGVENRTTAATIAIGLMGTSNGNERSL